MEERDALVDQRSLVSVITINKDNLRGLRETVASVAAQSYRDFEHILVDGASKDGSIEYIRDLVEIGSVIHQQDDGNGIYQAMNLGIAESKSDYVIFLNSGDKFFEKASLEQLVSQVHGFDVAYGIVAFEDSNGMLQSIDSCKDVNFDRVYQHTLPSLAASLIARNKLLQVGCFDTQYKICGDVELVYKIVLSNGSFRYVPAPVVIFDMFGVSSKYPIAAIQERLVILMRTKPEYLASLCNVLVGLFFNKVRLYGVHYLKASKKFWRAIGPLEILLKRRLKTPSLIKRLKKSR